MIYFFVIQSCENDRIINLNWFKKADIRYVLFSGCYSSSVYSIIVGITIMKINKQVINKIDSGSWIGPDPKSYDSQQVNCHAGPGQG